MTFVKIPSNLLPASNAMITGFTNNVEADYAKYIIPFTIVANEEYNLQVDYTSLGGTLNQNSWLWGTAIWVIGH
jgi:hypothetical protein